MVLTIESSTHKHIFHHWFWFLHVIFVIGCGYWLCLFWCLVMVIDCGFCFWSSSGLLEMGIGYVMRLIMVLDWGWWLWLLVMVIGGLDNCFGDGLWRLAVVLGYGYYWLWLLLVVTGYGDWLWWLVWAIGYGYWLWLLLVVLADCGHWLCY